MSSDPKPSFLRRMADLNAEWSFAWVTKGVPVLLWLIGLYYTFRVFMDMLKDTTPITNTAFGILVALGALSFSAARAVEPSDPDRDRFAYAGERFFHAAILLLSASLLKYVTLSLGLVTTPAADLPSRVTNVVAGSTILVLFASAMNFTHTGFMVLTKILWARVGRYRDWDSFW